jgi:hypothetical protein
MMNFLANLNTHLSHCMESYLENLQGNSVRLDIYIRKAVYCLQDNRNLRGISLLEMKVLLSYSMNQVCIRGNLIKGISQLMD